jgi:transposase
MMNGTASRTFSTPETKGKQGRPAKDSRTILNGIVWIARSGAPWRDLPARYGPWETVYSRFCKWIDDGVLDTAEKSYSEKHLKKYRKYYNILWRVSKPKDYKRFIIQANSCLTHNAYE